MSSNELPIKESLFAVWQRSPEQALAEAFSRARKTYATDKDTIFIWTSVAGAENNNVYGRYRYVTKQSLVGRSYRVEIADYNIAIRYLDAVHLNVPGKGFITVRFPTNGENKL